MTRTQALRQAKANWHRKELAAVHDRGAIPYGTVIPASGNRPEFVFMERVSLADILDARAALDGLQPFDRIKLDG